MAEAIWEYYRVSAWAVINYIEIPVCRVQLDFELNGIPRAIITLPVGREARLLGASPAHNLVGSLREMQPAQVWMNMTPNQKGGPPVNANFNIPDVDFQVFDGYTSGAAYAQSRNGVQFTVFLNHWLVRLNESSCFSKSSHPGNPSFFTFGALQLSDDTGARDWVTNSQSHKFLTAPNLTADLWGKALYPWFTSLCQRDGFLSIDAGLKGRGKNDAALGALARLAPGGKCYQPLALDIDVDEDIASGIAEDVALTTGDPEFLAHTTLWDAIVAKFAPSYCYAVVPRVLNALVVPYVPGYRGVGDGPFANIKANDYDQQGINIIHPRPLRAYGILSSVASRSGADMTDDDAPPQADIGIGGLFDTLKDGSIVITNGPRWLGQLLAPSRVGDQASGGNLRAVGTAMNPGVGTPTGARQAAKGRAATIKSTLDRYAQARFAEDVLRGRQATIGGAVRFDIAPGSVVRVETEGDQFIADRDALGEPFFAEVMRYTLAVDAEGQRAGSAFHLAHIRSTAENGDDETSVAKHPIYKNTFDGCALF